MARCLALLGMVATHVLDDRTPSGDLTLAHVIAGGRASALFAVLAGLSVALITGGRTPVRGRDRAARSAGLVVRALAVALVGLLLGELETGLAIILTYYGVLFCCALPFLGLRSWWLFALAGAWLVAGPVLSQLVRPRLPERGYANPSLEQLAEPGRLFSELLFTGYYPVVPWLTYLLVGLAIGRLDLTGSRVAAWLAAAGGALAVASVLVSDTLTRRAGAIEALLADPPPGLAATSGAELREQIAGGMFGTTPSVAWEWLLVRAPHSATPFDLAHTAGSAMAVTGLALLVVGVLPRLGERAVAVFFGAGTMTLTLYAVHVVMRTEAVWPAEQPETFRWHVLVLLAVGAVYVALGRRGPLERAVGALSGLAARAVAPRS